MKFTRRQVLEAIRFENLVGGGQIGFCSPAREDYKKECEVCAVGGVLRRAGVDPELIDNTAWNLLGGYNTHPGKSGDLEEALNNKNYLLALSVKFEQVADKFGTGKRTRTILANFVKKEFPKEFKSIRN